MGESLHLPDRTADCTCAGRAREMCRAGRMPERRPLGGEARKPKGRAEKGETLLLCAMPYPGFHERNRPPDGAHIGEREGRGNLLRAGRFGGRERVRRQVVLGAGGKEGEVARRQTRRCFKYGSMVVRMLVSRPAAKVVTFRKVHGGKHVRDS